MKSYHLAAQPGRRGEQHVRRDRPRLLARHPVADDVAVGSRAQFAGMKRVMTARQLRPVIDRVFPFAAAPAAFRHVRAGGHLGTTVISHG